MNSRHVQPEGVLHLPDLLLQICATVESMQLIGHSTNSGPVGQWATYFPSFLYIRRLYRDLWIGAL